MNAVADMPKRIRSQLTANTRLLGSLSQERCRHRAAAGEFDAGQACEVVVLVAVGLAVAAADAVEHAAQVGRRR